MNSIFRRHVIEGEKWWWWRSFVMCCCANHLHTRKMGDFTMHIYHSKKTTISGLGRWIKQLPWRHRMGLQIPAPTYKWPKWRNMEIRDPWSKLSSQSSQNGKAPGSVRDWVSIRNKNTLSTCAKYMYPHTHTSIHIYKHTTKIQIYKIIYRLKNKA